MVEGYGHNQSTAAIQYTELAGLVVLAMERRHRLDRPSESGARYLGKCGSRCLLRDVATACCPPTSARPGAASRLLAACRRPSDSESPTDGDSASRIQSLIALL